MGIAAPVVLLLAVAVVSVRWLRVAQREHYIPGSVARFAWRWTRSSVGNTVLWLLLVGACMAGLWVPVVLLVAAGAVAVWPWGLALRGATGKLTWTRRLRTAAGASLLAAAVLATAVTVLFGLAAGAAVVAVAAPALVDAGLLLTAPLEAALADRHLRKAAAKLARIKPVVVAVTGSYGKTSTKEHVRDLLSGSFEVVASPASFNNKAGLSRAIKEHMGPSCEVFVAEMGTYGPGEIRELCAQIRPSVAVITAIGPVHLERMGSLDEIAAAKAEILDTATTAVLNVDSPHLAALATEAAEAAPRLAVLRCGTAGNGLDVEVVARDGDLEVRAAGMQHVVPRPEGVHPANVACALGAVLATGVTVDRVVDRITKLSPPAHRAQNEVSAAGVLVIDDTYNANPDGARAALRALRGSDVAGRRVIVTPGMVELGASQHDENRDFARRAAELVDDFLIVNTTNRAALLAGARAGGIEPIAIRHREQAVEWVRSHLRDGDAVLYENDLPDHYP